MTKPLLLCYFLCLSFLGMAQKKLPERERAGYWVAKGQNLMRGSQYAEAYSAFQLARSLGAPDMAAQMELAKKRNLNSIQFRSLLAEARARAATDPTQSLRLLEYARSVFPDSISVLKAIGEIANQPGNWYYTLEAGVIEVSPKFTYLFAQAEKDQLYIRMGGALRLVHTFAEQFTAVAFSPDERYLFVGSARQSNRKGQVYRLDGSRLTLVRTIHEAVQDVLFSPNVNPAYGAWLLAETRTGRTKLYDLLSATRLPVTFDPLDGQFLDAQLDRHPCAFSPGGRYLRTTAGLWQLTPGQRQPVPLIGGEGWGEIADSYSRFSPNDRDLLITHYQDISPGQASGSVTLSHYAFSERGDTLQYVGEITARCDQPRMLWRPFSADSRYLTFNDSLFYRDKTGPTLVQPTAQPGQTQLAAAPLTEGREFGSDFQFAPGNRHVLREVRDSSLNAVYQVWRLDGAQRSLIHTFTDKDGVEDDVFSPDGRYLLARHRNTDRLWRIGPDTAVLVHTFQKSLRAPTTFDEDGFPKPSVYFSPDSRYLITYAATPATADSLWQLPGDTSGRVVPLYGFPNRLNESGTSFSPDSRLLLTVSPGYRARIWNLTEQVTLPPALPIPPTQALFSPKGNYLITDQPGNLWRVTDRQVQPFQQLNLTEPLMNYQFSVNEQYLTKSRSNDFADEKLPDERLPDETRLYRLLPDRLLPMRAYKTESFGISNDGGNLPYMRTYQGSLFSPDGTYWLKSQAVSKSDSQRANPQSDTTLKLMGNGVAFAFQTASRIDRYTIEDPEPFTLKSFPRTTFFVNWDSRPAALFSRDSRFLMTQERDSLRFYSLHTNPVVGRSLLGQHGFPMDVSEDGTYWLTGVATGIDHWIDQGLPDMPDTVRLWRRTGPEQQPVWKQIAQINGLYTGLNAHWPVNLRQPLFSTSGNYLLLPTTDSGLTTLYRITGGTLRPILYPDGQLLAAAHLPPDPKNGWDGGVLCTDTDQQTYLFRYGPAGTRTTELGYGLVQLPPRFRGNIAYWVRKLDDSQQQVELLDMVSGQTLVKVRVGAVLDLSVRPNGDAWVVSPEGIRLIRAPEHMLQWLKKAPVAPLNSMLRQTYVFH